MPQASPFWIVRALNPNLDLLLQRLGQVIAGRSIRKLRIVRSRLATASAVEASSSSGRQRLYIDLAVISRHDAGTGIQRVVRALALALIAEASNEWDVSFVAADRHQSYHSISWPDATAPVDPFPIKGRPGDVFLGLDFSLDTVHRHRRQLAGFRRSGMSMWFLVCDLLPVERPEWFSPNNVVRYKSWLQTIAGIADGFLCISDQTQDDLRRVLDQYAGLTDGYRTAILPMGYAIKESLLTTTVEVDAPPRFDVSARFSLMVGTLEPRKGHADIIAGFSALWARGADERIVLVGRRGWHVEGLCAAIRAHPEHGRKLWWFDDVDDFELESIYRACEGVIIGSHAEGFGLPLIEALGHDKPVLARDLPIFHMHRGLGVRYFPADADAQLLAESIETWLHNIRAGLVVTKRPKADWRKSARTVLAALEGSSSNTG